MANADSFEKTVTKLVKGNNRPELLKIINLAFNQPLIADMQGLKHISLYSTKSRTLSMHGDLHAYSKELQSQNPTDVDSSFIVIDVSATTDEDDEDNVSSCTDSWTGPEGSYRGY